MCYFGLLDLRVKIMGSKRSFLYLNDSVVELMPVSSLSQYSQSRCLKDKRGRVCTGAVVAMVTLRKFIVTDWWFVFTGSLPETSRGASGHHRRRRSKDV